MFPFAIVAATAMFPVVLVVILLPLPFTTNTIVPALPVTTLERRVVSTVVVVVELTLRISESTWTIFVRDTTRSDSLETKPGITTHLH